MGGSNRAVNDLGLMMMMMHSLVETLDEKLHCIHEILKLRDEPISVAASGGSSVPISRFSQSPRTESVYFFYGILL